MEDAERIGIRELRQHASRYVAMAKAGKRIAVTDRGKLVAYLVPADRSGTVFERMVAAGQVRLATGKILGPPARLHLRRTGQQAALGGRFCEMRDEERLLIYLDTSAFLKTVMAEPESGALRSVPRHGRIAPFRLQRAAGGRSAAERPRARCPPSCPASTSNSST